MAQPYNSTAMMEVLVAITSRLYYARVTPFTEDDFDAWQSQVLRLVRDMSRALDNEDGVHGVTVLEPDQPRYEDMMDEFRDLLKAGIPTWHTLFL